MKNFSRKFFNLLKRYRKPLLYASVAGVALVAFLLVFSTLVIEADKKYILSADSKKQIRVGIVLGAGITKQGKPFKELQARLDIAAKELKAGQVKKLILSGDNRFKNYDEPTAMKDYLVSVKHLDPSKLQVDFAGRSTYESCERASKVFKVNQAIIYSAKSHLPRAIYLCRHFGVEAYGVSSGVEANNGARRELLARVKAVYNVYVHGEDTILGPTIKV